MNFFSSLKAHSRSHIGIFLLSLIFLISAFNYALIRDTKDALLLTQPGSGAETIATLKSLSSWVQSGFFVVCVGLFYKTQKLPLITLSLMGVTLLGGALTLLLALLNQGGDTLIFIKIFYIIASLWGGFIFGFLLFALANSLFNVTQARYAYPLILIMINLGGFLGGYSFLLRSQNAIDADLQAGLAKMLSPTMVLSFIFLCLCFYGLNRFPIPLLGKKPSKALSLKVSEQVKYLFWIGLILVSVTLLTTLISLYFKAELRRFFMDATSYSDFVGEYARLSGFYMTYGSIPALFILWILPWRFSALLGPILTILGLGAVLFIHQHPSVLERFLSPETLETAQIFFWSTAFFNILLGTIKGTLFRVTTEMLYIPLPSHTKFFSKGVIDLFLIQGVTALIPVWLSLNPTLLSNPESSVVLYGALIMSVMWFGSVLIIAPTFKKLETAKA